MLLLVVPTSRLDSNMMQLERLWFEDHILEVLLAHNVQDSLLCQSRNGQIFLNLLLALRQESRKLKQGYFEN